jgi:hypothetical protein
MHLYSLLGLRGDGAKQYMTINLPIFSTVICGPISLKISAIIMLYMFLDLSKWQLSALHAA